MKTIVLHSGFPIAAVILIALVILANSCGPAASAPPLAATPLPVPTKPPTVAPSQTAVATPAVTANTMAQLEQVASFDLPDSFINTLIFSPDGRTLIAADRNGEVLLWDRELWEKTVYLPASSEGIAASAAGEYFAGTLALSPDGTIFFTVQGEEGTVSGRDQAGQELFSFVYGAPVYATAVSPDGRFLAVGGFKASVSIFDLGARQLTADLANDYEYISNLAFSPDSKTLVISYERPGNVIKAWDTASWQETATLDQATERFDYHDLVFSPDGTELVIVSTRDPEIQFLDLATRQVVRGFPEHTRASYQVVFSPDEKLLASAGDDGTVRFWDLQTGANIKTIRTSGEAGTAAFSPDGALIAFSVWGKGVEVWAAPTGMANGSLAISPDTVEEVELLRTLGGHSDRVQALAFSGDGDYIASSSQDRTIKLWDVRSGQEVHVFQAREMAKGDIAFSPDGSLFASPDTIWDVESGQVVHSLEPGRQVPGPVAFSPDGSLFAVALANQPIKLWDVAGGQLVRTFERQADNLARSIEFSPDGTLLAAGGNGGTVRLWDVESGQIIGTFEHGTESHIHGVAFSPDGSMLASCSTDSTVRLWGVASGQAIWTLAHGDGLYGVAFSPDGRLLASAGCDRTVKLWDIASGQLLRSLPHGDEVMAVVFSPDGTMLVSGGYDNLVYLWGIP